MNLVLYKHETFKGLNDSKRLLDRSQNFNMLEGKNISAFLPKCWKKSLINGTIMPTKMRFCKKNAMMKECVIGVIFKLMKTKKSRLI